MTAYLTISCHQVKKRTRAASLIRSACEMILRIPIAYSQSKKGNKFRKLLTGLCLLAVPLELDRTCRSNLRIMTCCNTQNGLPNNKCNFISFLRNCFQSLIPIEFSRIPINHRAAVSLTFLVTALTMYFDNELTRIASNRWSTQCTREFRRKIGHFSKFHLNIAVVCVRSSSFRPSLGTE